MNSYTICSSKLSGEIKIPPSKSQTLRAILFGMLGTGKTIVKGYLESPDTFSMVTACRLLGATIDITPDHLVITGTGGHIEHADDVIHAGNSGIVLRFIAAISALSHSPIVLTGDHSLRTNRPIKQLIEGLTQLGASAISTKNNGFAPLIVNGPLKGGKATVYGEDSQPISSLIIASIFSENPVELHVINSGEKPWIDLTFSWLDRLSIPYERKERYSHYYLDNPKKVPSFEYFVPGDLSSAAFPIAAAIVTQSELSISNVDLSDMQGDKKVIEILREMGAKIEYEESKKTLRVLKNSSLLGKKIDINDCIDAIGILAVIGCFAEGETHLYNGAIAREKECDRIACLTKELTKMGANITEHNDGMTIKKSNLRGVSVFSHQDHRLAMALSIAGMFSTGHTTVQHTDCISKTYPCFKENFTSIGASIC